MALNMEAIGRKLGPITKTYDWKDVVLYALGVGAGFEEIDYVYEKNLKVIPSFSIAAIFDFLGLAATTSGVNIAGLLHGEQDLIFHNPIPASGTLSTEGRILNYYDKGNKGALIVAEGETRHSNGKKLFTNAITIFGRLDGGFGGEEGKQITVDFPARDADFTVDASPSPNQPLIYRLSGDVFQLHVDQEFARMVGFEKPIMHGLCTHGFACRILIGTLIPGRPEQARRMFCRFSRTLYPGDPIKVLIWKVGEGYAVWRVINSKTGETVIDNGIFEYGDIPKDEIRFDGRVAVITGAGGGLGRTYALELARRGAKVVVNDFGSARDGSGAGSNTPAEKVVAEIKSFGGEAVANFDNVATPEGGEAIVQTALKSFGKVDILINNAGILRDKGILKMEPDHWRAVIDVHLSGAYHVTKPAFAAMRENGYGRIVMTTSAAGLYGNFGQTNYSSAKMGLVGFMNTLKLEGVKYNIKVNTIAPIAASRLTDDILPPDLLDNMKPEFVSPLVAYLCSEQCPVTGNIYNAGMGYYNRAAVMTGQGVVIGGGKSMPAVEDVAAGWEKISDMTDAKEYGQLTDLVGDLMDAFKPKKAAKTDAVPGTAVITSVKAVFDGMPGTFNAGAAAGVNAVFQYSISGEGGGDWYAEVRDGACKVEAGVHGSPSCTLKMVAGDFLDMMNGKITAIKAYTSGKLRIEGDLMKSQLIEKLFKF